MTRTGKIARLPRELREQLNCRMADGEPGVRLVKWLNTLPETRRVLAEDFDGREITEQNLSEWKQRGYQDWMARQETLACARELAAEANDLTDAAGGSLTDHLAVVLSSRYAALISRWDGEMSEEFRRQARGLRTLCQDIVGLRRGDHFAGRLRLELKRFAEANKEDELRALETVIEEVKQWPEVRQAFEAAFALLRQCKSGQPVSNGPSSPTKSDQIKPETHPELAGTPKTRFP